MSADAEIATEHPHIIRKPGVCGGSPIIRNTRIAVWLIAALWKAGDSVDEIVHSYPHLRHAWVYDALSYYLDHQQDIEQEIQANRIENVLKEYGGVMDEKGFVRFPKREGADGR